MADRDTKRSLGLRTMRERNRSTRAKARADGILSVTLEIPKNEIAELDALKQRAGLRSRSQAFIRVMAVLAANPTLKQELGL